MKYSKAFTLIELLVVIAIIGILVAILIPVASRVRQAGYAASSGSQIAALQGAIERYYSDFRAYPGPVANDQVNSPTAGISSLGLSSGPVNAGGEPMATELTMSENLVLGLLGGLKLDTTQAGADQFVFDPALVGLGPSSLNPSVPRRYNPYVEARAAELTPPGQHYTDSVGRAAFDTWIPEFIDRFPDSMPVLYLRAQAGADGIVGRSFTGPRYQYDIDQITAYTLQGYGGDSLSIKVGTYHGLRYTARGDLSGQTVPAEAPQFATDQQSPRTYGGIEYFSHPSIPDVPRQKDGYILISPGRDRYYGSADDITSFGSVR